MKLLLLLTPSDLEYLDRFSRLEALRGHQVIKTSQSYVNPVTLDAVCDKHRVDAVLCFQQPALEAILKDTPDFTPPTGRKKLTLNDYAGSLLRLRSKREVVVCNPLERLLTVPEEKFILNRYVSKLTQKDKWLPATEFQWGMVTHENKEEVLAAIDSADLCAIDIETQYPQYDLRILNCVSYTCYDKKTHTTKSWVVPFEEIWHWEFIRAANASKSRKVFQRGIFDNAYFLRWGAPVANWLYDTYNFFHSWLSELPKDLGFITAFSMRDVRFWKDDGKTGNLIDYYRYNAKDGWATINSLLSLLAEAPAFAYSNYIEHEFPLVFPSLHAALEGLECDVEEFAKIRAEKEQEVESILTRLRNIFSTPKYNPGSWQQNEKVFELLGCGGLGGTGKIPTLKAKAAHPLNNVVFSLIEDYKKEAKQVGTYFAPEKLWHDRIYYEIDPGGTDTLRAASKESVFDCGWQIQNIPRDDPAFKRCVLAPPGWFIAEADKKQSEARCVAYLSGDPALLELVESTHDYHAWNAAAFFGIPYEKIFDEETGKTLDKPIRDLSKRTNHGANYNMGAGVMLDTMGPKKVAEAKITLKLPAFLSLKSVCRFLLDRYEATYPVVKGRWYESIIQAIETTKRLVSPFGWVRIFHGSPRNNKQHLNSAVAHAPQNLSVTIINKEWYKIWRETVYGSLRNKVRIKAQIHDSLLFIYRRVEDAMKVQSMMDLRVNVTCSGGITRNMFIPSDLSLGKEPTRRWSDLK